MKATLKNLGKVSITPKGEFDAINGHEILDIISYQDRTYIAKKNAPNNILPTNEEYYMKLPAGEKIAEDAAKYANEQGDYAKQQADRIYNLDLNIYRVVTVLPSIPSMSDTDKNKIYLKISVKQGETNKYDEYVVVDNAWELLEQYEAAIDLTEYVGKTELSNEIAKLPSLDNISAFVCIDNNGNNAGIMSKEQVAQVVGELTGFSKIAVKEITIPPNSKRMIDALGYTDILAINLSSTGGVALFLIGKIESTKLITTNIPDFGIAYENNISKPFYAIYVNGHAINLCNNTDEEVIVYYRWLMIGR